ncbi:hypothetical protein [Sulfurimonas sp.]|uniref:hypothetical protein n=1 Tax=Sulfurimonas sp. TaxID=2022749 RepID=UPI0035615F50
MARIILSQSFNNGVKRATLDIDTDVATAEILVAFMPDGVGSFSPDGSGASGTARPVPPQYIEALAVCRDSQNPTAKPSFVGIRYGKPTLSDDDIANSCGSVIKLTSGVACDKVQLKKYKLIGAAAPVV